ncbi:hypothetical protein ACQPZA_14690 [Pseudonocardia xinjiangensis]|uniref:hypothetical protein n=1 Tax=Pseudonocardia xinjiangensis TaxID=75289 RepID=UPI003D8C3F07
MLSTTRVGRLSPVTYVLDDDIDPSDDADLLWAVGTRIRPKRRQEFWEGPVMAWYPCYLEEELHAGRGATVVHDGPLPAPGEGRVPPATFAGAYPPEVRKRVLAAVAQTSQL